VRRAFDCEFDCDSDEEEQKRRHNEKDVGRRRCELNHDVCFQKVIKSRRRRDQRKETKKFQGL
jgi:hypothetical protein